MKGTRGRQMKRWEEELEKRMTENYIMDDDGDALSKIDKAGKFRICLIKENQRYF